MIILINGVAIAVGAIVGVFLRNIIADRFSQHIMQGLALCVFLVGIKGAIQIPSSMIMILSLVCGALVGEGVQMEEVFVNLRIGFKRRLQKEKKQKSI